VHLWTVKKGIDSIPEAAGQVSGRRGDGWCMVSDIIIFFEFPIDLYEAFLWVLGLALEFIDGSGKFL
jgi:hypothetical protein